MLRGRLVWGRFVTWVDECCILPDRSPFKPLTLSLHQLSQFTTRMIVWKWGFKVSQRKKGTTPDPHLEPWKLPDLFWLEKIWDFLCFRLEKLKFRNPDCHFISQFVPISQPFFCLGPQRLALIISKWLSKKNEALDRDGTGTPSHGPRIFDHQFDTWQTNFYRKIR